MLHPLFINWNPDPAFFGLSFIRWYGVLFALSFLIGYRIFVKFFKNEGIDPANIDSLTIYAAIGTIVGARFGHVFFYEQPSFWINEPWRIFAVWEGGLASHGAAIGIITAMILYSRRVSKRSVLWLLDRIVVVVALSGLFIRTGNLVNSEIEGNVTDLPWGTIFQKIDQDPPFFYATQEDRDVKIHISAQMATGKNHYFNVLSSTDRKSWQELGVTPTYSEKQKEFTALHRHDLKQPIYYRLFENQVLQKRTITGTDSTDVRKAELLMDPESGFSKFEGEWKPEGIQLYLTTLPRNSATIPELMKSYDLKTWQVIKVFPVPENMHTISMLDPETGTRPVFYRVSNSGERRSMIFAAPRHPSMVYEALAYLLIFVFLFRYYWAKKGKVREGELFGYFLVLVFTFRLLIEFTKTAQEQYDNPFPLNTGQLLSIPFILAGFYFIYRSRKVGVKEYAPFPELKKKGKEK